MVAAYLLRAGLQALSTRVVAHALPLAQDIGQRRLGQGLDTGKTLDPTLPATIHTAHLSLLEHDLANPDGIGVARIAPRQVTIEGAALRPDGVDEFREVHKSLARQRTHRD